MSWDDLKERGIQALSLVPLALLVAALTCPATDLEPPWGDGDETPAADPDASGSGPDDEDAPGDLALEPPPGPPVLQPLRCTPPEAASGDVCVLAGTRSATVRWAMDRAATGTVDCLGGGEETTVASAAPAATQRLVAAPLAAGTTYECVVRAGSADGEVALGSVSVSATGGGPWIVVTEVLADPTGPEPAQEFVELANLDEARVDLTGWRLEDEAGGGPLPDGTILDPGAVALLVPDDYDPNGAGDPAASRDAVLVPMGRSLGTQGLRNSGEAVRLIDRSGAVVSLAPGDLGDLGAGVSAVRVPPESPEADPAAWVSSADGGPTPGWIDY